MSNQVSLLNNHPSMTLVRSTYDHVERDKKQASPDDHRWQAWGSPTRPLTRSLVGLLGCEPVQAAQRPIVLSERARHVYCMTTAGGPRPVRLQKAGTESNWQGRAAAVITELQVSETWPCFRKSWPRQYYHEDHQLDGDTCLVPNNPYWILGKSTPSLDKWTLFPGINIKALIPIGAEPSLDPRNHIFIYFLCIHSIVILFFATFNIYSQSLLCHYWL